MAVLFGRRVKLVLAVPLKADFKTVSSQVTTIDLLRVAFKITKSLSKDPNAAEITVYNLSAATRAALPGKGAKVLLQAGYDQTIEQIFLGDARLIESTQKGVDWETKIECGDGARAFAFARTSESFAAGAAVLDVAKKIANATGLDIGNVGSINAPGQYTQGYAAHGRAIPELDKVLRAAGYELSIQDGALQALKDGETTTETVVVLDATSGLIGSPEMGSAPTATEIKKGKKPILKARSLLQPILRPGRKVRLKSLQYSGDFRVVKVEHSGDTAGGAWYSDLELEAL